MAQETVLTVRDMVEGGVSLRSAIMADLDRRGLSLMEWADAGGHNRSSLSKLLNGEPVKYEAIRDALCKAFDLDRSWLDERIAEIR